MIRNDEIFCTECGTTLKGATNFCTTCGAAITKTKVAASAEIPSPKEVEVITQHTNLENINEEALSPVAESNNITEDYKIPNIEKKKKMIMLAAIAGAICLCIVAFFIFKPMFTSSDEQGLNANGAVQDQDQASDIDIASAKSNQPTSNVQIKAISIKDIDISEFPKVILTVLSEIAVNNIKNSV